MAQDPPRRVALVTGAAVGIGQAIAVRLAADGLDVAVGHHARPPDETLAAIAAAGGRGIAIDIDVTSPASVDAGVARLLDDPCRFASADVAALVAYLASPEAGFVTGAVLDVNGGSYFT